jgi:predicted secreted protein
MPTWRHIKANLATGDARLTPRSTCDTACQDGWAVPGTREHHLGPDDAGRTVEVAAGDRLVLSLPETAGTGYTWEVEALPPGAEVVEERYEQVGPGVGGTSRHVFVLSAPGEEGELRLRYLRPWRGEDSVTERYALTASPAAPAGGP